MYACAHERVCKQMSLCASRLCRTCSRERPGRLVMGCSTCEASKEPGPGGAVACMCTGTLCCDRRICVCMHQCSAVSMEVRAEHSAGGSGRRVQCRWERAGCRAGGGNKQGEVPVMALGRDQDKVAPMRCAVDRGNCTNALHV